MNNPRDSIINYIFQGWFGLRNADGRLWPASSIIDGVVALAIGTFFKQQKNAPRPDLILKSKSGLAEKLGKLRFGSPVD